MNQPAPRFDMSLQQLFDGFVKTPVDAHIRVRDIKLDSRQVHPGDLFVALRGSEVDGTRFIHRAIERGAVAVALDAEQTKLTGDCPVPLVRVENIRARLGDIADRFFASPSRQLCVIGITGTNGKTSCCQYIAQSLAASEVRCGMIGTLGWGEPGKLINTGHTTPDVVSVHRMLAHFVAAGFEVVVMEVSSHGLDQMRVNGVRFDTGVFTNLTRDHLDYHQTMQHYGSSKRKLFEMSGMKRAVLNVDDNFGSQLYRELGGELQVVGYALDEAAQVRATSIQLTAQGIRARVSSPWGEGILSSQLLGRFNLSNLLAVFTVLCLQGLSVDKALAVIAGLENAPGRMQRYGGRGLPVVVVDYAHTADALMVALATLRELSRGRLICVFGCGGERDKGKRPQMGKMAERFSDQIILTNDNPRREAGQQIIDEILAGITRPQKVRVCLDRSMAIQQAVSMAGVDDVVLVAGKGHENYQEIGGVRMAFNDGEQVKQALYLKAHKGRPQPGDKS
ncbi:MAG: UDP-N-acetylmuramoyl-L-alanyl-D-glutamate--2,6-diaminopimelate ligase [Pseudomonadales bacterium]